MKAFQFLQDFYLHFAQFYTHTSYALALAVVAFASVMALSHFSWPILGLTTLLYLVSGFFFIIGRLQFAALFKAEWALTSANGQRNIKGNQ